MSEDKNPSKITRQDILDAIKKPDVYRFKEPVEVIRDKKLKRNDPVVTVTDEALAELRKRGLTQVDQINGEMTSVGFGSKNGKEGFVIHLPSRTHVRWGDKGQIQNITDIEKELPLKKAALGLELSGNIVLAEANVTSVEVPAIQIIGNSRQV